MGVGNSLGKEDRCREGTIDGPLLEKLIGACEGNKDIEGNIDPPTCDTSSFANWLGTIDNCWEGMLDGPSLVESSVEKGGKPDT